MTEENETIQLYNLNYTDLVALSSSDPRSPQTSKNVEYLQSVMNTIMKNLGPSGPGLLAVTGVPVASDLRRMLLPLARKLALLNNDDRKRVLKVVLNKDHGLGSDVPLKNIDRTVSPFAMQLKYNGDLDVSSLCNVNRAGVESCGSDGERLSEFNNLGNVFKELGNCMIEMGLRLARVCDKVIGGHELEQSLLESCSAKGRLIHYHSILDNITLQALNDTRSKSKKVKKTSSNQSDLWQQWHYDYGVFTILTDPMFMFASESNGSGLSCDEKECHSPSGHTYLQILDPNKNSIVKVKASSGSFIVQVGESADILSKGKLRATLHSVCRPKNLENISRETFVVFLQPAWSKTLSLYDFPEENPCANDGHSRNCDEENQCQKPSSDISKLVPPLCDRLKDGMTFAEFSRETTKQYYGSSGLQTKR
ncbi:2-oxoglutarate (2OG) and Fe(II)-dependent oxygenase superfamily protein [Tanacetum coccineum]